MTVHRALARRLAAVAPLVATGRRLLRQGLEDVQALVRAARRTAHRLQVHAVANSHLGQVRQQNEDYYLIVELTGSGVRVPPTGVERRITAAGALLVVADGMGGAEAGEVASAMAANTIFAHLAEAWRDHRRRTPARLRNALLEAMERANREIHAYASQRAELTGMGTTATAVALLGEQLHVGHVGDSRAYVVRGGCAQRITRDHSLVQHLIDIGELTPEAAATSPHRNVLLRALGPQPEITVDVSQHGIRSGDLLVLCSDGLWSCVDEGELVEIVTAHRDLATAGERLIELANERGGPDNITVIIARLQPATAEEAVVPRGNVTAVLVS